MAEGTPEIWVPWDHKLASGELKEYADISAVSH
jgi:hypothetical protein